MNWVILILISAAFLSIRAIFTKKILDKNNPIPVLFLVTLFTSLLTLLSGRVTLSSSFEVFALMFLKSLILTVSWYSIYQAYKHLEISTVAPLRNLSPAILVVLSAIFLGESIGILNYLGIAIMMSAAYMLELRSLSDFLKPFKVFNNKYFLYILVSMVGSSFSAVLDKHIARKVDYFTLIFFYFLFSALMCFLIIVIKKEFQEIKNLLKKKNIAIVLLVAGATLMADIFYFAVVAIPSTLIVLIIPLRRLSTFITTIIGGNIFKEKNIIYKGAVCLVMLVGVYFILL
ncbi:hypothetical protein C0584_06030 [Candidatus Parcubacteria bacterium]|nr:MAG: hypothetical protein C0584_06030 [Candidatus Parcubacteria bacterium]